MNSSRLVSKLLVFAIVLTSVLSNRLQAAVEQDPIWALCDHNTKQTSSAFLEANNASVSELSPTTIIHADQSQITNDDIYTMEGNVHVNQGEQNILSDSLIYKKLENEIQTEDSITYSSNDVSFQGSSAHFNLSKKTGIIRDASYQFIKSHARGNAKSITMESQDVTLLKSATYTTCNPGDNDWLLKSSKVRLNHATGIGSAQNVRLSFMHIPFLYFPYMSFPIDDKRKTGFLPPSYKNSEDSGNEFVIPYYINIAPHRDAMITPRFISKRGTLLSTEFRYLNNNNSGNFELEYLSNDKKYGDDRSNFSYNHSGSITPRLRNEVLLNHVSDPEYFEQLGNKFGSTSTTHVEKRADLTYAGDVWTNTLRLQGYQTVDETIPGSSRPYERLPQLLFNAQWPEDEHTLEYKLNGEFVSFERKDSITGHRLDLQPNISLPISTIATFITPSLSLRHTRYQLDNQTVGLDNEPTRTLPVFSLDSGIFFERNTSLGSHNFIQTLEPRIFYLNAPFKNQDKLPVFDTGAPDFNFTQLFMDNRFSGVDRAGDANQVSYTLTTRFLENETGIQRFSAGIGQIHYFRDRKVGLPGSTIETDQYSSTLGQLTAQLNQHLSINSDLTWDSDENLIEKGNFQLRYSLGKRSIFNLGYQYRSKTLEQIDTSILWPIHRKWHFFGRWNHSYLDEVTLETVTGLQYESCCWKLDLVNYRYLDDTSQEQVESVMLRLELKGLGGIGRSAIQDTFDNGVLGF